MILWYFIQKYFPKYFRKLCEVILSMKMLMDVTIPGNVAKEGITIEGNTFNFR